MQHFTYMKTETFNKKILGINLANLTQYQASNAVVDKFNHAREEYLEIQSALKKVDANNLATFFPVIDGAVDLDYVLNGIIFVYRRAQMNSTQSTNFKTYRTCIDNIRHMIPSVPYMFAYNLVHRANMKKFQGRVEKRTYKYGFDAIKPHGWKPPNWHEFFKKFVTAPRRKIAILGYSGAGKDTMAEILNYWYGYRYIQATRFILENYLWEYYNLDLKYDTYEEAYADRVNNRVEWYNMVCDINRNDPATVAKAIYANSDIYCGIRSIAELKESYDLIDRVYWIHCGKRILIERGSNEIHGAMLLKSEKWKKKTIVIENKESLFKFKLNIYKEMARYE